VRAFSTRSSDPTPDDLGAPVGTPIGGTLTAGRPGVNQANPLHGNGFSIVAGATCDDGCRSGTGFLSLAHPGGIRLDPDEILTPAV
jgi:hypothetical protein